MLTNSDKYITVVARELPIFLRHRRMLLATLARRSQVPEIEIVQWLRGEGNPSMDTLDAVAHALGVPYFGLLNADGSNVLDVTYVPPTDLIVSPAGLNL